MVNTAGVGPTEKLLNDGWDCHDEESEQLARDLEAAAETGVTPDILAPFLHLSTHTIGEHLGDWARALRLGKRVLDGRTPTFETAKAWARLYVAAVLAGEFVEAAGLELSYLKVAGNDFGPAVLDLRFMLAEALIGSKRATEGARVYRSAIDLVGQVRESSLLDRTIAVVSNNLGWELYEMESRAVEEDALMKLCAEMSLRFWLKCGTWINDERALYLKAVVANATGDPTSGLASADAGLAIIARNSERLLDAALLQLARAESLAAMGDHGKARAISEGDALATRLTEAELKARYATVRARVIAGVA
jgi:hypothetical protein